MAWTASGTASSLDSMIRYTLRRILQAVLVLWATSVVTFLSFWATPAVPAREICNYHCTAARLAEIDRIYGWDEPLLVQYATYMSGLVDPRGRELGSEGSKERCAWPCFDRSIHSGIQVWDTIADAIWPTVWLATGAAVLWLAGGMLMGTAAALHRGRRSDRLLTRRCWSEKETPVWP